MSSDLTYQQAVDDIFGDLKTITDTLSLPVYWEDVPQARADTEDPYCYANIMINEANQATLGPPTARQFERFGALSVMVYDRQGQGLQNLRSLATSIADAFEGGKSTNGVWYRSVLATPAGRDGLFQMYEVAVSFRYTEIK